MPHGHGYWTFGWIEAEREQAKAQRVNERARRRNAQAVQFNQRWTRLNAVLDAVRKEYLKPLLDRIVDDERNELASLKRAAEIQLTHGEFSDASATTEVSSLLLDEMAQIAQADLEINQLLARLDPERVDELRTRAAERSSQSESDQLVNVDYQLSAHVRDASELRDQISIDIESAAAGDLSRYATAVKKVALRAIKLCKDRGVKRGIDTVKYDAKQKFIQLNGSDLYFLG